MNTLILIGYIIIGCGGIVGLYVLLQLVSGGSGPDTQGS